MKRVRWGEEHKVRNYMEGGVKMNIERPNISIESVVRERPIAGAVIVSPNGGISIQGEVDFIRRIDPGNTRRDGKNKGYIRRRR